MHHEYEDFEEGSDLAQGDVIYWEGSEHARPWRSFAVIVTADCDLAFNKHGGHISYVPALLTTDYVWYKWRREYFSRPLDDAIKKAVHRVNTWLSKSSVSQVGISSEALNSWIRRAQPETILDEMGVSDKSQRNSLLPLLKSAYDLERLLSATEPDLKLMKECFVYATPKFSSQPDLLAMALQSSLASLPGDIFHLPITPDDDTEGLFLMLRHISQCTVADIAQTADDLRFGNAKARRVARISPTYRYAITQNLARVFADIGLPTAYEGRCREAASKFWKDR